MIAIDGPAGTGKSSVSRLLAQRVGAHYLDTGAMYRAATLAVLRSGVGVEDADAMARVVDDAEVELVEREESAAAVVLLDGEDVSDAIREAEVTANVSAVSANPAVRAKLVELQRRLAGDRFVVVEGRDIGTVVFPAAELKVYLTATPEARAARRLRQDTAAGRDADYDAVLASVNRRDHLDTTREASPLRPADDAVIFDTSELTLPQVLDGLITLTEKRIGVKQ
ncbi:(d)CMP kinase [Gordonia sp. CPCC 205333]|uniref:(d)CMP kinase n=1 Tax=Gordonia sp. CPCC 205333 TaxID=3140790 RepID=UPI003AF33E83